MFAGISGRVLLAHFSPNWKSAINFSLFVHPSLCMRTVAPNLSPPEDPFPILKKIQGLPRSGQAIWRAGPFTGLTPTLSPKSRETWLLQESWQPFSKHFQALLSWTYSKRSVKEKPKSAGRRGCLMLDSIVVHGSLWCSFWVRQKLLHAVTE